MRPRSEKSEHLRTPWLPSVDEGRPPAPRMNPRQAADTVRAAAQRSTKLFRDGLPMIASENIVSPRVAEMLVTDFHGRYAEGLPGKRYYQGCGDFDTVEALGMELARQVF